MGNQSSQYTEYLAICIVRATAADALARYHLPNCLCKARTMSEIAYIPALPGEIHQKKGVT